MLSEGDIEATNVLPAFEASLRFGVSEEELEEHLGWRREELAADNATVSGESTYRHMELMYGKRDYSKFVLAATALHGASSLGVVGLACKTVATVGEALICHARFQQLTNRTATYATSIDDGRLTVTEDRPEARLGSRLISDYTMLIAHQVLGRLAAVEPRALVMRSRRDQMSDVERSAYARFLDADVELGAEHAQLVIDAAVVETPVASADPELAAYLTSVLRRAAPFEGEPRLLRDARVAIRDVLVRGTPTAAQIARALGLGQRTLQRRLAEHGQRYAELLESTRRSLAEGYLANGDLSLAEVAYLLGYSEQASFFRAFRRWHDTTPAAYRSSL